MLLRRIAERPQGVLQTFRERDEALAPENDMGHLEPGEWQAAVVEPMLEQDTGDGNAKVAHVAGKGRIASLEMFLNAEPLPHVIAARQRRSAGATMRRLSVATRKELTSALAQRYRVANRVERSRILDEFVGVSGSHRKHAMRLLRGNGQTLPGALVGQFTKRLIEMR